MPKRTKKSYFGILNADLKQNLNISVGESIHRSLKRKVLLELYIWKRPQKSKNFDFFDFFCNFVTKVKAFVGMNILRVQERAIVFRRLIISYLLLENSEIQHSYESPKTPDKQQNMQYLDDVIYPPPPNCVGGDKKQGSNTIMSTSFALKFWSNKIIDGDIILSTTLTVS